jgi:hypothetical protein
MRDVVDKRVGPEQEVSLLGLKIGRAIMWELKVEKRWLMKLIGRMAGHGKRLLFVWSSLV